MVGGINMEVWRTIGILEKTVSWLCHLYLNVLLGWILCLTADCFLYLILLLEVM